MRIIEIELTIKHPSNTGIRNIKYVKRDDLYEFRIKINGVTYTKSSKDLQIVLDYANQFYIDHDLTDFLYKPEEDVRCDQNFMNFDITNHYHPVYTVTREYMAPPNPENVITPFKEIKKPENVTTPFKEIKPIKPFTIIDEDKFYGKNK